MREIARPLRATLSLLSAAGVTLGVLAAPTLAGAQALAQVGSAVTVRGPRLLNPATINPTTGAARLFRQHSTVTVSQTAGLVSQAVRVSWTEFTPTPPGSRPYDSETTPYPVAIAECRVARPRSEDQCFGIADREGTPGGESRYGPDNAVYATTGARGRGTANIALQTGAQNRWLGCGPSHACSLAVIPVQGGDIVQAPFSCSNHLQDAIGTGNTATASITFGPPRRHAPQCSWRDRITIPLRFAPAPASCRAHSVGFTALGSPMLARAMDTWATRLCAAAHPLAVSYNPAISEPAAIRAVRAGRGDVALTTRPAASLVAGHRRYTYAPVAVSAASVGYWVDNVTTGQPFTDLRLSPRLVAKMLTTSYDLADVACKPAPGPGCDPGVNGNPADPIVDPEFARLNPGTNIGDTPLGSASSPGDVPILQAGPSDMTYETTRWIAASGPARRFLAGQPDPFGMHVNTRYKGVRYPESAFVPRDPTPQTAHGFSPVFPLSLAAQDMVEAWPPGTTARTHQCGATSQPPSYCRLSQEIPGDRVLFGVLDYADTAAYLIPSAAIANPAGRFVAPTPGSLAAALRSMVTARNGITQQVSTTSRNPAEYPLTVVIYAMVPTRGIGAAKATRIARWLRFIAGLAQSGLPPGYLPLTARLRALTLRAASAVQHQTGATTMR